MANDFTGDGNCKALWRFENGALTTDTIGTNTLVAAGPPTSDQVIFKEGAGSVDIDSGEAYSITDANLDAGYPHKNGDAIKKFSICFWVWNVVLRANATIYAKTGGSGQIWIRNQGDGLLELLVFTTGWEIPEYTTAMVTGRWYHVGITHDDSDKSYRMRIWDDTAGSLLDSDLTGNLVGNIRIAAEPLNMGNVSGFQMDGKLDEMVVFNRILSAAEIDTVRSGTFPGGGGGAGGGIAIIGSDF